MIDRYLAPLPIIVSTSERKLMVPCMISVADFLTNSQIAHAVRLKSAQKIHDEIISPNWETINKKIGDKTGQYENLPMYFAYMVEYAITTT